MGDKIADMLASLQQYTASIKLGCNHAARIIILSHRFTVLNDIFKEMNSALLVEHESVKEILDAGTDPQPPAYVAFMAHYEEFKVIHKLMQDTAKEIQEEKGFVDWHMDNGIMPDYNEVVKHLKDVIGEQGNTNVN
jgi:hypothetical protein